MLKVYFCLTVGAAIVLSGCTPTVVDVMSSKSPVELRAMQEREFDTQDRTKTMRVVISTLQDLGYRIDKVEATAGTISAVKLTSIRLTTTVVPHGDAQTSIRANAMLLNGLRNTQVDTPVFYQQLFFDPLSKALFLTPLPPNDAPVNITKVSSESSTAALTN